MAFVAWFRYLLLVLLFSFTALGGPEKLDPALRFLLASPDAADPAAPLRAATGLVALQAPVAGEELEVRVFLLTRDPDGARSVAGFRPHQVAGTLATGSVLLRDLLSLSEDPQVLYVQASRPVYPALDVSVPEIGAPALWYGSPRATGRGVIVGIVDTGIDPLHRDFRVDRTGDGFEEGSRILWLWDQGGTTPGGFPPWWGDGTAEARYGRVYSQQELEVGIASGNAPVGDPQGHGTHVAAIAAGDGSASPQALRGVAPEADLVVVKTTFYEDTVVDGVRFVFEAAQALGKPAVVNLSLGGHGGSHDGNSLFERMIDALVDRPGRVVVAAAGNEGNRRIHVGGDVRAPTTWHLELEKSTVSVRFWHSGTATFSVSVRTPGGEEMSVFPGGQRWTVTASGGVWIDNTSLPDPLSGDRSIYLALTDAAPGTAWAITLTPVLGGGRVDGWVEQASAAQFREGDTNFTISEPGNARRVITVGAYITKTRWTSVAGEQRAEGEVGALAPFSSRGPTRDGRIKPDLAAPGAWIASARSRMASPAGWLTLPGGEYAMLLGTSMAAPHVAGAAALLLSLRPDLTWLEVKDALTRGARVDSAVGAAPNTLWGAGKLDVSRAATLIASPSPQPRPVLTLLANPVSREARFRYSLPAEARWATLQVYDLSGRLLYSQPLAPPAGDAHWPLTTTDGRPVASGLYLAVLVTDRGPSEVVRVVVQR